MPPHNGNREASKVGRGFSMRAEAGRAEILLYDVVDNWYGISAKQFHDDLAALGEVSAIDLRINSPGGSITEGMAVYSILKRQSAKVVAHVDGVAASMASIIAMAASEIVMTAGSYLMIHNPAGSVYGGDAAEMRDYAELLDKMKSQLVNIYAARSKQSAEQISVLMDAETWFTADEAIAAGFADRSSPELALAASIDPARFTRLPQALQGAAHMSTETLTNTPATPPALPVTAASAAASYADLKAALVGADAAFLCAQMEANATSAQAQAAWMAEQNRRLEAARTETADANAKLAGKKMGVEPLGSGSGKTPPAAGGDAIERFEAAVAAKVATGMKRHSAAIAVIHADPELHEEYVAAVNADRPQRRR